MTTVLDLITSAMKELGAIAIGEVPTAAEAQDALTVLNNMLGLWKTESLMVYAMTETVLPWPSLQASYTIGTGGDLNTPRPVRIEAAYNRQLGTPSNINDYVIEVVRDYEVYSDIVSKGVSSSLVSVLYYDATYPLGTIKVWPIPSDSNYQLVLWTWGLLDSYAAMTDTVSVPPGYEMAMVSNLAIYLAPRYGRSVGKELSAIASSSKAQIKRSNLTVKSMFFDRALVGPGHMYNIFTDRPN